MTKITHIVVHYTATYEDQDIGAAQIDEMHRQRGFNSIGYHWVIRRNGVIEKGRPESVIGAHVGGQNTGKIGISWVGGLNRATGPEVGVDNRTPDQTASLISLIRDCLKRYPGAKVVGHRDLANTQCPGFDVGSWWAKVSKGEAVGPKPVAPETPSHTEGVSEDRTHIVVKGDTFWSIARSYNMSVAELADLNPKVDITSLKVGQKLNLVYVASKKDLVDEINRLLAILAAM